MAGEGRARDGVGLALDVPVGYRRTEVGVIPEDWEARSLRSTLAESPSYGINAPAVPFDGSLPTYIRITDIGSDGRFRPTPRVSVNGAHATSFFLKPGDLVFARTGASVGKSYLYDRRDGPLVFAGFLIRLTPDPSRLRPAFIAYYVQTGRYWRWIANNSARSGQPGINSREYGSLPIPVPPVAEQQAIAAVLSDVDELIGSLEALIAKKRAIKQATMQRLLTGRTRLPGFGGEWEAVRAGDIGRFGGGSGFPVRYQGNTQGDYPFFKVSDMNRDENRILLTESSNYITEHTRQLLGAMAFPPKSIAFAKVGAAVFLERKRILAKPSCLDNNMAAFTVAEDKADILFVYHLLSSIRFSAFASTTALPSLSGVALSNIRLLLPPLPEQQAIATVLSDMDAEIAALEHRLDKTRAIKQGMMQQLLTGSIRLPIPNDDTEDDHAHDA